jgi:site-specific DNA recombinase
MKAAIYAHVNKNSQDFDLSIPAQIRVLREYAIKYDLQIVKEFVDEAES